MPFLRSWELDEELGDFHVREVPGGVADVHVPDDEFVDDERGFGRRYDDSVRSGGIEFDRDGLVGNEADFPADGYPVGCLDGGEPTRVVRLYVVVGSSRRDGERHVVVNCRLFSVFE